MFERNDKGIWSVKCDRCGCVVEDESPCVSAERLNEHIHQSLLWGLVSKPKDAPEEEDDKDYCFECAKAIGYWDND